MRIIGGELKGRRLSPPVHKWKTRPTTDFAREALFNILENTLDYKQIRALDLFGGTGAHAIELVSRGVQFVTYVEKFGGCCRFVQKTVTELKIDERVELKNMNVLAYLKKTKDVFDYIFADPPFALKNLDQIPNWILESKVLAKDGLFVLEHGADHGFEDHRGFIKTRKYSSVNFSFFGHI